MVAVSFQNVSKRFGKTLAVDGVSLTIEAGELFFLLGPSGCGKTTCLRMCAGFEAPDAGVLRFGERDMTRVPPHKRNTGMVFQNYALWPHMTVRGNVEYGLKVRGIKKDERETRVRQALETVRLEKLAERYPNQMSGGQQQRVALARALIIRPDVLLLDEPLSNLDAQLRLELREEIKNLHRQSGATALYVTHDQEEALSIADRIAVLKDGKLIQAGAPRELYRRPNCKFVAAFLGETNFVPGVLRARDEQWAQVETPVGILRAARPEKNLEIGTQVWCAIRPEAWHISNASAGASTPAEATNALTAILESAMFLGASEQWKFRLTGGRETMQRETMQRAAERDEVARDENAHEEAWREIKCDVAAQNAPPRAGQEVIVHCAPEDVVVLDN